MAKFIFDQAIYLNKASLRHCDACVLISHKHSAKAVLFLEEIIAWYNVPLIGFYDGVCSVLKPFTLHIGRSWLSAQWFFVNWNISQQPLLPPLFSHATTSFITRIHYIRI